MSVRRVEVLLIKKFDGGLGEFIHVYWKSLMTSDEILVASLVGTISC